MAIQNQYIAYLQVGGYKVSVHVSADKPEDVVETVKELFKEIEGKVEAIRVADAASGFFLRGFS